MTVRWHYEFIPSRGTGYQWRVGDDVPDDFVCDFATEKEARECVRLHNATLSQLRPYTWRS